MWLLFDEGFVSIVQKDGEDNLCVWARVASDLDTFQEKYCPELSETTDSVGTDYKYRAWATHTQIADAVGRIPRAISYDNFKDRVAIKLGRKRASIYGLVWEILSALTP